MATWTVHARDADLAAAVTGDRLKILREGFSWGALLVPFLWTLWNRLWLVFVGWLAITVAIQVIEMKVNASVGGALSIAFVIWFALAARDLQRWTLERRGWRLVAVVEARDVVEAEARFVSKLNAAVPPSAPPSSGFAPLAPLAPLPPLTPFGAAS